MRISVIIPIYKGKKYISSQISQVESAAKIISLNGHTVELILVNDDPDDPIEEEYSSSIINIVISNCKNNTGIQQARIRGLSLASGDFIHFLDQDDKISLEYYSSQLDKIDEADAIYCRCYNGDRQTYNYDRVFETAFDREKIFSVCPVITPGQVVIKRDSIPELWKNNILKNYGSDDYFLWLCMYANGAKFASNQDILFTHVRNGDNYSSDILRTKKSDDEMVDYLINSNMFNAGEIEQLKQLSEKQLKRRYIPQRKDQIVLQILSELLKCYENGHSLDEYLISKNSTRVAIYGAAVLGERIKGLLTHSKVKVVCFIDKNAPFIDEDIPVTTVENVIFDFDAVIISQIENEDKIHKTLREYSDIKCFTIREIVKEMSDEINR